jgi:hypothetical protein
MTWESAHIPPVRVEEHGLRQPESATVGVCAPEKAIFWLAAWNNYPIQDSAASGGDAA